MVRISAAIEDQFSSVESCQTLSTVPVAFSFLLRSGNTELLSHQKIQAFPANISPLWLPCCSSQRCCRCNPKRSALLKDPCGSLSEKLKLCWICTACSGWSGGITTDVSEDDNQQQPSETELENPEANESNKFLVEYLWVGIVHEVKGDPHSLSSDCTLVVWRIAEKMLGIECWSILWLQWANLTTVLPTNSTWAWEVLYLKQYKMCFANITAENPYHSLQTFHLLDIMNLLCPLAYNLPLKFCVWGWGGGGGRRGIYDEK